MRNRTLIAALAGALALAFAGTASATPRERLAGWQDAFASRALQGGAACFGIPATVVGTAGEDVLTGTAGQDVIAGLEGNDTIDGLGGADIVCAGDGNDTVAGGAGDDLLSGDAGDDSLDGGAGVDAAVYLGAPGPVNASLAAGSATGDGTDVLLVEGIIGSPFADSLTGNGAVNFLDGDAGNDVIVALAGMDFIDGGAGSDDLRGGPGFDQVYFDFAPRGIRANLRLRRASGWGADTFTSIEDLWGSNFADRLTGNGIGNILAGGRGNDVLKGLGGRDRLLGQAGNDRLYGGRGADVLNGGVGAKDWADGGPGRDRCRRVKTMVRCP